MARSLYICYFGVREPLVQTQVIPYLRELVKGGHQVSLLTFEREAAELLPPPRRRKASATPPQAGGELKAGVAELREELREQGIQWDWLRYHKRPSVPATVFDLLDGTAMWWARGGGRSLIFIMSAGMCRGRSGAGENVLRREAAVRHSRVHAGGIYGRGRLGRARIRL